MKKPKRHNFSHHIKYGRAVAEEVLPEKVLASEAPRQRREFPIQTREIRADLRRILTLDVLFLLLFIALFVMGNKIDLTSKFAGWLHL